MIGQIDSLQRSHLPGCHLGGGAQHGLQELEQLTQHKDGLPSHHLLAKIGDVGRLYAARLPKPLRQWLRPSTQCQCHCMKYLTVLLVIQLQVI